MATTLQSVFAAAGFAVLLGLSTSPVAAKPRPVAACAPATTAAVPAEYFLYHALVAPNPVLPSSQAGTRSLHASCTPHKVIRT